MWPLIAAREAGNGAISGKALAVKTWRRLFIKEERVMG
jgi:hypothetical protein